MIVRNRSDQIFIAERLGAPGEWQFPQGGVEPELSEEENVFKELTEELGAPRGCFSIERKLPVTHTYLFDAPKKYRGGTFDGQTQTYWLVRFTGDDSQINLEAHQPEFSGWRWCGAEEVKSIADPRRYIGYEKALAFV